MMDKRSFSFLKEYITTASPSGMEQEGQKKWLGYIEPFVDEHFQDNYFNTVAVINPDKAFKIVLEAHADEVSWRVNYISEQGFIHVIKNGGGDANVAPGQLVLVHTSEGVVEGVFGWPAIHVRKDIPRLAVDVEHLFVDCGSFSRQQTEGLGVQVGDIITYTTGLKELSNGFITGRALDNRIGGLIIAEVARELKECKVNLPFGLYIVNAVQEEVGSNGAGMIAHHIKPDIALVTDVTHDTNTPYIRMDTHGDTACGRGPVLPLAPAVHAGLLQLIMDAAEENNIPYQRAAVSRETGTDTDAIALSQDGICSALIATPLRYMHTPVEVVYKKDVENVIRLFCETLKKIKPDTLALNKRVQFYD